MYHGNAQSFKLEGYRILRCGRGVLAVDKTGKALFTLPDLSKREALQKDTAAWGMVAPYDPGILIITTEVDRVTIAEYQKQP